MSDHIYVITVYTPEHKTFNLDVGFTTYSDAKSYLIDEGYVESNRWFKRKSNGWYRDSKAIITRLSVYQKEAIV